MLIEIFSFLLNIFVGLISGACLLRAYMQAQRAPFSNSIGQLVFALTNWIVLPLRKVLPAKGRWDLSSIVAAFLLQIALLLMLWLLTGGPLMAVALPWLALCGLLRVAISGAMGILIVYAVLSWVQPYSPVFGILQRLSDPLLGPARKLVPSIGGVDLSAMVTLIALQVLLMVLGHLEIGGLRMLAGF